MFENSRLDGVDVSSCSVKSMISGGLVGGVDVECGAKVCRENRLLILEDSTLANDSSDACRENVGAEDLWGTGNEENRMIDRGTSGSVGLSMIDG